METCRNIMETLSPNYHNVNVWGGGGSRMSVIRQQ